MWRWPIPPRGSTARCHSTSRPVELLARLDVSRGQPLSMPDIVTIAELVLRGLGAGQPAPRPKPLRQPLADAPRRPGRHPSSAPPAHSFRPPRPESARARLLRCYAGFLPRSDCSVGAVAVLVWLLATDPEAAVALVAASDEADVSVWLPALCWGLNCPPRRTRSSPTCSTSTDPETGPRSGNGTGPAMPEVAWLQRAWQNTEGLGQIGDERIVRAIARPRCNSTRPGSTIRPTR